MIPTTLMSMEIVLKFLYTGKMDCDSLSLRDIFDLMKLLELMEEKDLFLDVEEYLIEKLEDRQFPIEKVLLLAKVCEDSNFKRISNKMLDYICESKDDVEDFPEVRYLSSSFLEMLIDDKRWVIDCDDMKVEDAEKNTGDVDNIDSIKGDQELEEDTEESEYDLLENFHFEMFKMFVNWLSGNPDCGSDFKERILKMFDLDKFESEELTYVRQSSLFSDKDVFDALVQKNVLLKKENERLKFLAVMQKSFDDMEKKAVDSCKTS